MMSNGLRHVNKDTTSEKDVETPSQEPPKDKVSSQKALGTAFSRGRASSRNPVFLAKAVFRKVFILLVSDEEDLTKPGGIITLIKDITLGVILWVISIPILLFLDHRGIIHYHSAHSFRNTAFQMLNDLETIAIIEESTDLHFLPVEVYESTRAEIDGVADKLRAKQEILERHVKEGEEIREEHGITKLEHERLMKHPLLDLANWCGDCKWGGGTCEKRVEYMTNTYGLGVINAQVKTMSHQKCQKNVKPKETTEKEKAKNPADWCGECIWGSKSCNKRVQYLKNTYGSDENEAKLSLMREGNCKK